MEKVLQGYSGNEDHTLFILLRKRDQEAFEMIYRKYHRYLYALAMKYLKNTHLAEDAVQHVFVKLWESTHDNHMIGTQKGAQKTISGAETQFHIYAVEWTADYIKGFVDGEEYFRFNNDGAGNKETWPFNVPFYLKLNLAWGGDWGGAQGVDESKLPATYEIDYVRVYQKK